MTDTAQAPEHTRLEVRAERPYPVRPCAWTGDGGPA